MSVVIVQILCMVQNDVNGRNGTYHANDANDLDDTNYWNGTFDK